MQLRLLPALSLLASATLAQTKSSPPPSETYESSIVGSVIFPPLATSRFPVAAVKAIRIKPTYWTSPSVTTSLRGDFQLTGLPAGEYVLCAGSSHPQLADSCFWFDGIPDLTLAAGQRVSGQKIAIPAGRTVELRLRDPARELTAPVAKGGTARTLVFELHGPAGTVPRALLSHRPESDGQSYRIVVPAAQPGLIKASATGLRLADDAGRELPSVGFSKALAVGADRLQLEFRILGPAIAVGVPGQL